MKDSLTNIFIIAGMPRTGTTFLAYNLRKHPSVFLPYRKETDYFSVSFDKGFDWYRQLYQDMSPEEFGADISPSYFMDQNSIERIKNFNPNVKIILGVREPAEWALSYYQQILSRGLQVSSFEDFLKEGYLFKFSNKKLYAVLNNEFIIQRIEKYREAFGINLMLYPFNILNTNPLYLLRSIENFIGLPTYFNEKNFDNIVINSSNRRNLKILTYLLNREEVIFLMKTIFPRKTLHSFQNIFSRVSKKKETGNLKVYHSENIKLAKEVFLQEEAYVQELFCRSQIQLGTGSPFEPFL